jgi:uncharacterized OB-fold protein
VSGVAGAVRWASYTPAGSAEGRRVAAPDEDAFTLAATAIERLLDGGPSSGPLAHVDLVGEFPAVVDWGVTALVGSRVQVARHPRGAGSFRAALEHALRATAQGRRSVVVAAELPEREGPDGALGRSIRGASAVAVLIDGDAPADGLGPGLGAGSESAVDAVHAYWGARGGSEPASWVGDWTADPRAGSPVELRTVLEASNPALTAVSEGAYVPRPRYIENLPSRWRFAAEACDACGAQTFPARGVCRQCGSRDSLRTILLPTDGATVIAATTIGKGGQPTEFDTQVAATGGYGVVLAELAPGARVTLQVTDAPPGAIAIGSKIGTRLRRLYPMEGEWRYGRKAVPLAR